MREIMAELFPHHQRNGRPCSIPESKRSLKHWKLNKIDLSGMLHPVYNAKGVTLYNSEKQDHGMDEIWIGNYWSTQNLLLKTKAVFASFDVKNTDRTIGTMLSNEISKTYGSAGLPEIPSIISLPVRPVKALAPSLPRVYPLSWKARPMTM